MLQILIVSALISSVNHILQQQLAPLDQIKYWKRTATGDQKGRCPCRGTAGSQHSRVQPVRGQSPLLLQSEECVVSVLLFSHCAVGRRSRGCKWYSWSQILDDAGCFAHLLHQQPQVQNMRLSWFGVGHFLWWKRKGTLFLAVLPNHCNTAQAGQKTPWK